MCNFVALQTQLASVMETLVHAAVAELCKLAQSEPCTAWDPGHTDDPAATLQTERQLKMTRFASIMETLGNEALGKIMKIVDDTKFLMEFEQRSFKTSRGRKSPRTSVLNILSDGGVEAEHSYGAAEKDQCTQLETPFVLAVSVKDEHGAIDLGAIVERAAAEAFVDTTTPDSVTLDLQRLHSDQEEAEKESDQQEQTDPLDSRLTSSS
ncbi:hypothetical protein CRUP_024949, partial [Coryphaenoides rupestris]